MITVLHVDDDEFDLELVQFKLKRVDNEIQIESESSARTALRRVQDEGFDAVLCDFQMPEMDGLEFLRRLRSSGKNTPFIFLTGQGNERLAVEALQAGADDYFTKEESLAHYERLVHSLRTRVKARKEALDQQRLEHALNIIFAETHPKTDRDYLDSLLLKLTEILDVKYALICELFENNSEAVRTISFVSGGEVVENITYELAGTPCANVVTKELCVYKDHLCERFPRDQMLVDMKAESYIGLPLFRRNGEPLGHVAIMDTKPMKNTAFMTALLRALSVRVGAEIERIEIHRELTESEKKLRNVVDSMISGFALHEVLSDEKSNIYDFRYVQVNPAFEKLTGLKAAEVIGKTVKEINPDLNKQLIDDIAHVVRTGEPKFLTSYDQRLGRHFEVRLYSPGPGLFAAIFNDISERKEAELAVKKSEQRFRDLFSEMMSGFALHEIICDDTGVPIDYRFLEMNEAFEKLTGLRAADTIGKRVREAIPEIEDFWIDTYGQVALTGQPTQFSNFNKALNRHYEIRAYSPAKGMFAAIFNDITMQVEAERALRESEQRFRALVELNVAGIFRSTLEGQVLECNDALLRLMGYESFSELEGINLADTYVDPAEREVLIRDLRQVGSVKNRIVRILDANGKTIECLLNVQLLEDDHILGTMIEVSEPSLVQG